MEVTRSVSAAGEVQLSIDGRIDGYWADHLDAAIGDIVREGQHRIALDCAHVTFLSSAGIGVLLKHFQALRRINGAFHVVNPSPTVANVLRITRLSDTLLGASQESGDAPAVVVPNVARRFESEGLGIEVYNLDAAASVSCVAVGNPEPLATGGFRDCVNLDGQSPAFAIGVGAFGEGFDDCQGRFGELISVAGATACQPADGTNVPDYLVTRGALGTDVRLLYGLVASGAFSHLARFEPLERGGFVAMSSLLSHCLEISGASAIGVVVIAETEGLVGAALRRSPAQPVPEADFFAHPSVRTRLSFSAERTFTHSVSLTAGFAARGPAAANPQFRSIGGDVVGHLHAAAFRFQPIQKGWIDLPATVTRLFEPNQLSGVVHLLNDDRGASGAGESELIRGACWIAAVA